MSLKEHPLVSDWLALRDGRVTITSGKVDIGQRISTALAQVIHEELGFSHDRIEVAPVTTGTSPDEGMTSGSNSVEQSGRALRLAAATLRAVACRLAAERFGGEAADWALEDGHLTGPGVNRPVRLSEMFPGDDLGFPVDLGATLRPAPLRQPAPSMRGLDELVSGRYRFVHDLEEPGMLHARVIRPPHAGARLRRISPATQERLEAEGLNVHLDGSFLAVAGPREWPVIQAAQRLFAACDWDLGEGLDEVSVFAKLRRTNATRLTVLNGSPAPSAPLPPPLDSPTHSARFERPYTMHGALAPSAALACWDGSVLRITTHSQGIYPLRNSIAESLGFPLDQVVLTHAPGSGCYGHNGADDAAFEAALIAVSLPDTPILLKWTREDEHAWEPYGPPQAVELAASLDAEGAIAAFSAEAIAGTYRGRPRPGPGGVGPAKLLANRFRAAPAGPDPAAPNMNRQGGMQRNLDPAYQVGETRYVKNLVERLPLRSSALRCLGAVPNIFAIESFIDEIAHAQGRDPMQFRLAHLEDARARAVLERLARELDARPAPAPGGGRGIAYAQYKNAMTRLGVAVDIFVNDRAEIRLDRALMVADAGRVLDINGLVAQLEGGFLQGASWALYEQVSWNRDGVTSRDWDSYPVLRFENVPRIEVIVLDRQRDASTGAGEAAPGPAIAAIANALFDATGLRLRRIPFSPDAIIRAALAA